MFENLFKAIDLISPKITLFYEGSRRYSTVIGGIFTILLFFIGFACFTNQLLSYLNHNINYIQHYRNYVADADLDYEFNNNINSFFIFANFLDYSIKNKDIDFNKIRLIATFTTFININESSLLEKDYWLFDKCDNINLDEELIKLSDKDLNKAVCLKYYYNSNENKYYSVNDKNFKTPKINKSIDTLSIYVHKCINNSIINQIYGNCVSENEIVNYIDNQIFSIKLSFLAHQINTKDTKNPNQLYINSISSRIQMKNTYTSSSLTFSPLIIERDIGIVFYNNISEKSYSFQGYIKATEENTKTNGILNLFCIMFENSSHSYKISYKTIYDLLTKAIIFIETIYYILFFINYIFNLVVANINIQNIIFHKKTSHNNKKIHLFLDNYKYNLGHSSNENIQNISIKLHNRNISKNANKIDVSKNELISNKSSMIQIKGIFNNNNNKNIQINNIIRRKNYSNDSKVQSKYIEGKIFGDMIFTKKDIALFFKYLICNKWNNSPLLLFDSIQKKLLSVEQLFKINLLILYKRNNKETNLINICKFLYE